LIISKRDFDNDAASWDTPARVKLAEDIFKAVIGRLHLTRAMNALDFGCGTGLVTLPLSSSVNSVTGVDASKGMLEVLKSKVQIRELHNVKTLHLDLTKGDQIGGPYHVIISSMVFHHVEDIRALLEQLHQALLPGGYIAIADLDEEGGRFHENNDGVFHFGFDREKFGRLLTEAGFTGVYFNSAAHVNRPDSEGRDRLFDIFLITGRKQ
jgi:2-polyprenyl-3-methyl-5-hydroxy-6-metoxy-1,4-benzoquinol methylase